MIDLSAIGDWKGQLLNIVNSYEGVNLVGSIVLLGAALGLVQVARGRLHLPPPLEAVWPLVAVSIALFITLYYLGTPLLNVVYDIPGLSNNLFHRSRYLCTLFLVVVGAAALDAAWTPSAGRIAPSKVARAASGVVAAYLLVISVRFAPDFIDLVRGLSHKRDVVRGMTTAAIVAVLAVAIVRSGRRRAQPAHAVALSALLFAQLAYPLRDYNPQARPELFAPSTSLHEIVASRTDGRYRYLAPGLFTLYANDAMVHRLFDVRGQALQDPDYLQLMQRAAPTANRDPWHVLVYASEFDYASTVLDHLAVKVVVLSTNDTPFGRELSAIPHDDVMSAPGPIAGVWITPRLPRPCTSGFVAVRLERPTGELVDEARRPIADVGSDRLSFALAGTAVLRGDDVRLRVSADECELDLAPELNWIVEDDEASLHITDTDKGWVYERRTAHELVTAHTTWTSYDTRAAAIAGLADRGGSVTTVEHPPPVTPGTATVDSYSITTNRAAATVRADGDALVVFSMNDDPNWRARVDGRSAPIVAADGALMAVAVGPGTHRIELTYQPRAFTVGAIVTVATIAVVVALLWYERRRTQRRTAARSRRATI
jgi:hypothetical protein